MPVWWNRCWNRDIRLITRKDGSWLIRHFSRGRPGDKPLSEPISLLTHMCVTRPKWAKAAMAIWEGYGAKKPTCKRWNGKIGRMTVLGRWSSLETLKASSNIPSDNQGSHPHDLSVALWRHNMESSPQNWAFVTGIHRASNPELWYFCR